MTAVVQERVLLEVAWAAAGLLAGRTPGSPLEAGAAAAALVCRDALVRELRVVLRGVLGVGLAAPDPYRSMPPGSVVRALHVALVELDVDLGRRLPAGFRTERLRLSERPRHGQAGEASAALLALAPDLARPGTGTSPTNT